MEVTSKLMVYKRSDRKYEFFAEIALFTHQHLVKLPFVVYKNR